MSNSHANNASLFIDFAFKSEPAIILSHRNIKRIKICKVSNTMLGNTVNG